MNIKNLAYSGIAALCIAGSAMAENDKIYQGPDRVNLTGGYHVGASRTSDKIEGLILHITDSEGKSAENWFHDNKVDRKRQVSAHYIVEKDGDVIQIVPENKIAYHCSGKNTDTIGIEFVGKLEDTNKRTLTKEQLDTAYKLIPHLQKKYDIKDDSVRGHRDFSAKECPGKKNMEHFKHLLKMTSP